MSTRKLTAGSKIPKLQTREGKQEIVSYYTNTWFENFIFTVTYGKGSVKNHIVLSDKTPVSLCGRYCDQIGPTPFVTPWGVMCYRCVHVYKTSFTQWLDKASNTYAREEETDIKSILEGLKQLLYTHPNWVKAVAGIDIPVK